jgi:BirA family transcriptional regulator, biotin operon repressor / biotin---[acetyl-CoA-carboxylase] ligase
MSRAERTHELVLQLLKEKKGKSASGTGLASRLNLSRTSVWKHIQRLRSLGYEIISHPKEGYTLTAIPDLLIPEEIVPHLETSWLAGIYHHYRQIGSTNDEALLLAAQGAEHGTVVVAEEQTKGRGRLHRSWVSPAGCGIYFSIILRSPLPVQEAPQSTMVAALGLVKVLSESYGLQASIKWPNDVLIEGKKVAGILADMQSDQDHTRFVVIGIGINANHTESDLAGPFRYPATSLAMELGVPVQRRKLFLNLLHRLEQEYDLFFNNGFGTMLAEFERASAILGRQLQIQSGKEALSGKALGFTPEGALRLLKGDGKEEIIWVGDVLRVEGHY